LTDRATKSDNDVYLEHAKPLVFGKESDKGIALNGLTPEVVPTSQVQPDDLLIHDEQADPALAFALSRMHYPDFPEPLGIFRAVQRETYDNAVRQQTEQATSRFGEGDLQKLITGNETWTVK